MAWQSIGRVSFRSLGRLRSCGSHVNMFDRTLVPTHMPVCQLVSKSSTSKSTSPKTSKTTSPSSSSIPSSPPDLKFETLNLDTFTSLFSPPHPASNKAAIEHILTLYEHQKYTGKSLVPSTIMLSEMVDLLQVYPDEREIFRLFKFFFTRQLAKDKELMKKAKRKEENLEAKKEKWNIQEGQDLYDFERGIWKSPGVLEYGLWHNSIMSRIQAASVRSYRHRHLLRIVAMFGQKMIIDLDYDEYMKIYECKLLAKQLGFLYYENRLNRDTPSVLPFDIHFTNCEKAVHTMPALKKQIKLMDQLSPYFHAGSYLEKPDLFPKSNLVYLSPHARHPLRGYSHDDIFIIGGFNDRSTSAQVSHVKAQQEGIRCYRLPLDENVRWRQGTKNLCTNQVVTILQWVKYSGSWREAIERCAPQRKMLAPEEVEMDKAIKARDHLRRTRAIERSASTFKLPTSQVEDVKTTKTRTYEDVSPTKDDVHVIKAMEKERKTKGMKITVGDKTYYL